MHKLYERASLALGRVLTISREDLRREDGQGATEYGLVLAFVIVGLTLALGGLGDGIKTFLKNVGDQIAGLA
jgi:Flp pilus assembly pilin Flp